VATPGVFASKTAEPLACGAHPEPVHADEALGAAGCPVPPAESPRVCHAPWGLRPLGHVGRQ